MTKNRISKLWDQLGRSEVQQELQVTNKAVAICVARNSIPASWFDAIDRLAKKKRVKVSRDLFNFKGVDA